MNTIKNSFSTLLETSKIFFLTHMKEITVFLLYTLYFVLFFSPVLFSDRLIAPRDGTIYFLQTYSRDIKIWEDDIFAGYPSFADPQLAMWYPFKLAYAALNVPFNMYIITAFLIGSFFMYLYILELLKSRKIALIAGLAFGNSGFMIAHIGHLNMLHSAAWLPAILYSLYCLSKNLSYKNFLLLALSTAFCFLAGHPQIFLYAIILIILYLSFMIVIRKGIKFKAKFLSLAGLAGMAAIGLISIQLLPTLESYRLTLRNELPIEQFVAFSYDLEDTPLFFFPYIYGGQIAPQDSSYFDIYKYQYFGSWNLTELTNYIGISVIFFAILGVLFRFRKKHVMFYIALLVLALGGSYLGISQISEVLFKLPGFNLFKAHARLGIIYSIAVIVLASYGMKFIFNDLNTLSKEKVKNLLFIYIKGLLLVVLFLIIFRTEIIQIYQRMYAFPPYSLNPFKNPGLLIPLVIIGGFALLMLYRLSNYYKKPFFYLALFAFITLDLISFGWFYEWRFYSPKNETVKVDTRLLNEIEDVKANNLRILPVDGIFNPYLRPNVTTTIDIPSASGYSPLSLQRFYELSSINNIGTVERIESTFSVNNSALDNISVKYVLIQKPFESFVKNNPNYKFIEDIDGYVLYENLRVNPRVYFAKSLENVSKEDTLQRILNGSLAKQKVLVENGNNISIDENKNSSVEVIEYANGNMKLRTITEQENFLVVNNINYPGWKIKVNGVEQKVYNANYISIGTYIPAGEYTVEVYFEPNVFAIGRNITLISIILISLIGVTVISRKKVSSLLKKKK